MQTQSPHSPGSQESSDLARLLQSGCSLSPNSCCRQGSPDTEGKQREKKPALFLILATIRKTCPALSRLPRRDGTVGARRGHLSSSKREMRGTAPAGPAPPATRPRGCADRHRAGAPESWHRVLSSLVFLPRGFLESPHEQRAGAGAPASHRSLTRVPPAIWIVCQLKFSPCWSILWSLPQTDPLECNNIYTPSSLAPNRGIS